MVCRDAATKRARQVNPLVHNAPEEKALYDLGERRLNQARRGFAHVLDVRNEATATLASLKIFIESPSEFI